MDYSIINKSAIPPEPTRATRSTEYGEWSRLMRTIRLLQPGQAIAVDLRTCVTRHPQSTAHKMAGQFNLRISVRCLENTMYVFRLAETGDAPDPLGKFVRQCVCCGVRYQTFIHNQLYCGAPFCRGVRDKELSRKRVERARRRREAAKAA